MKIFHAFPAVLGLISISFVCFGAEVSKTVPVPRFDEISCTIPCTVNFSSGNSACVVSADEGIIDGIAIYVENGRLNIRRTEPGLNFRSDIVIELKSTSLNGIYLSGAVDFNAGEKIFAEKFNAELNGASNAAITDIKANSVSVQVNGVSTFTISKYDCDDNLKLRLNGAGTIDLNGRCREMNVRINGTGAMTLSGKCKQIDATLNGAGKIDLRKLEASSVNTSLNGFGKIVRE